MPLAATPVNHDRAGRVLRAVLADRPEQQCAQPTERAGAHHQQIGVAGGVDQHISSRPLNGKRRHRHGGVVNDDPLDRLRHKLLSGRLEFGNEGSVPIPASFSVAATLRLRGLCLLEPLP
jgi:hypothetical protein